MKDYDNIINEYGEGNFENYRILGGVKVYNIKNLKKINFYEKIVEYYNKSLEINAPRCGDDSLMVLYQIYNYKHISLLEPEFHVIFFKESSDETYINKITFFHSTSGNPKYWNVTDVNILKSYIIRYFYENMIEYIYNNFSIDFIKECLPEIYINIQNVKIPFFLLEK